MNVPSAHPEQNAAGGKRLVVVVLLLFFIYVPGAECRDGGSAEPPKDKVHFEANDPRIAYMGRIDFTDPRAPRFDWPGVSITAVVEGSYCGIALEDGKNDYNVFIDGKPFAVISTTADRELYEDVCGLPGGSHTLLLTKRTEGYFGVGVFKGLYLEKGKKLLTPPPAPRLRIEFIGDSITCGYGNEGKSVNCDSLREFQNNYLAYGAVAARELNAAYTVIAISGKGIVRNYGEKSEASAMPMPVYYNRVLQNDSDLVWNPQSWVPRVVIINLGTNDFSTQPQSAKDAFMGEYLKLVRRVRADYAKADIFCLAGTMAVHPLVTYVKEAVEQCRAAGDERVHFVRTPVIGQADCGCDWHPGVKAHQRIADVLVKEIRKYVE